jgi:hypothetical protein
MFLVQNDLKDALAPLFWNSSLQYVMRMIQKNLEGLWNWTAHINIWSAMIILILDDENINAV